MSWKNLMPLRRNLNGSSAVAKNCAKSSNVIPGPKYYPILGSLNELFTMGKAER